MRLHSRVCVWVKLSLYVRMYVYVCMGAAPCWQTPKDPYADLAGFRRAIKNFQVGACSHTERDRQSERERCLNTHASTKRRPQHRRTQTLGPLLFLGVARPGADGRHFEALAAALAGRQPRTPRRQQAAGTHLLCSSHTQGHTERVRETRAHVDTHTHTHLNTPACTSICALLLLFSLSLCLLSLSLSSSFSSSSLLRAPTSAGHGL
jgi:hypothetical protein